jgi:RNA methyltransferase, TrmH family
MPVRIVQSKNNPRLKQLRRALAQPLREPETDGRMLTGIEGPNLLEEALRAGLHIDCVFVAEGSQHLLDDLKLDALTEVLLLPKELLASVVTTEAPQPIAALVEPPDWTWAHLFSSPPPPRHTADETVPHSSSGFLLDEWAATNAPDRALFLPRLKSPALIVVLAGLQDPGNLGTILRSAEAFAANGVICLPGTVSAWNPKAVRASAGSLFRLPLLSVSEETCFLNLREAGVRILSTSVAGAEPANLVDLAIPTALIIGNEGNGVPANIAAQAHAAITIPCPGPVESLNAAVAASVLLYEASRQRGRKP